MDIIRKKVSSGIHWLFNTALLVKLLILMLLVGGGWFLYQKLSSKKTGAPQYQTATVERGTIISSVTATGMVATSNSTSVTTQASGVINKIYVKDGDSVKSGDIIADIDLDLQGKQRAAQSYASYQSAKNSLQTAKDKYYTLQSSMMTKWKTYMDTAQNSTYQNADKSPNTYMRNLPQFYATMDDWLATEADYKNQEAAIAQGQTSLNNTWLSYQQTSPTVYAPITGTITGFSLQVGSFITAQSNSSGGSTSQRIANVVTTAPPTVTVSLTEIDTPKVKIGNKATVTFDALPNKTFTGNVVSIDTVGAVTSGVTSYPATIKLDVPDASIYSNMGAQATIITASKSDVLMVPSASIQTSDGSSNVQILTKSGQFEQNAVETGISSDTQTEIISGLSEGDVVITSSINGTTNGATNGTSAGRTGQTGSIFGGGGIGRMGGAIGH
jgi:macrolide-specific efflux system membrane fusion protein